MKTKTETIINQDSFEAAMARWDRRGKIFAWGVLAFAVSYFGPIVIEIFSNH
jgi:hypothetical protein